MVLAAAKQHGWAFQFAAEELKKSRDLVLTAVKQAIGARESALKADNSASASLSGKKERLDKLRAGGGKEAEFMDLVQQLADMVGVEVDMEGGAEGEKGRAGGV